VALLGIEKERQIMTATIQPGSEVMYSAKFLRSICEYTGVLPFAKGHVVGIERVEGSSLSIASVDWGNDDIPRKVNAANLVLKSRIAFEASE
jgi:hypothetical protein